MRSLTLIVATLLAAGCGSALKRDFQATYDAVMLRPAPLGSSWQPDATVRLADEAVQRAVREALASAKLQTRLDLVAFVVTPKLRTPKLTLAPTSGCDACVTLMGTLEGDVSYKGMGTAGRTDLGVDLTMDARLEVEPADEGHALYGRLEGVRDLSIRLGIKKRRLVDLAATPISDWVATEIARAVPRFRLARFGTAGLPIRGLRVRSDADTLVLDLHTSAPASGSRTPAPPPITEGWSAAVSVQSVLAIARREAFSKGALDYGVWADPLDLELEDDTFALTLRLWRPKGLGWWRNYEITGDAILERGRLMLVAHEVIELDASPGAGLADPLASLARGRILDALADAVNTSIPSSRAQDIAGVRTKWLVGSIVRNGDDLVLGGKVTFDRISR